MTLEEIILEILHPTIWKSSSQIWDEVDEFQCNQKPLVITIGGIHTSCTQLVDEGLATERRRGPTQEEELVRGTKGIRELRLSDEGLRKRIESRKAAELPDGLPSTT